MDSCGEQAPRTEPRDPFSGSAGSNEPLPGFCAGSTTAEFHDDRSARERVDPLDGVPSTGIVYRHAVQFSRCGLPTPDLPLLSESGGFGVFHGFRPSPSERGGSEILPRLRWLSTQPGDPCCSAPPSAEHRPSRWIHQPSRSRRTRQRDGPSRGALRARTAGETPAVAGATPAEPASHARDSGPGDAGEAPLAHLHHRALERSDVHAVVVGLEALPIHANRPLRQHAARLAP